MADSLFTSFLRDFYVTYGMHIIQSTLNDEPNNSYMTYEEVKVLEVFDGMTFQGSLQYKPPGHAFATQQGDIATYQLVHITAPGIAKNTTITENFNGTIKTNTIMGTAQPVGPESLASLQNMLSSGYISLLNFGKDAQGRYQVYAFSNDQTCINLEQVSKGMAMSTPPIFINTRSTYNQKTNKYKQVSNNINRTPTITDMFKSTMNTATNNKVGIWTDDNKAKLADWISNHVG